MPLTVKEKKVREFIIQSRYDLGLGMIPLVVGGLLIWMGVYTWTATDKPEIRDGALLALRIIFGLSLIALSISAFLHFICELRRALKAW